MEYRYYENNTILCIFEKERDDIEIYNEIYKKLTESKAIFVRKLVDVDNATAFVFTLDDERFSLIYDNMMDTHLYGEYQTLQKVEQILKQ